MMKKNLLRRSFLSILSLVFFSFNSSAQVISAGGSLAMHSLAACTNGTVQSWGRDYNGSLGDDAALVDKPTPVAVANLTGVIAVSGGGYFSLALKSNGTVWSFGDESVGELGDDAALANKTTPVAVAVITGITAISAGSSFSLALKSDGTVWSWGIDSKGQLGDNAALTEKHTPVAVAIISGITAISAGNDHSLALKSDGTVWSWGKDGIFAGGALGDDASIADKYTPVAVAILTNITAISAGGNHSLALKNDGTVWAWGSDTYGQLGDDGSLTDIPTPVSVPSLSGIIAIDAGGYQSLALKNDGTVWSWGADFYGGLGDDATLVDKATPVQVSGLTGITAISAGFSHSLAVRNDGSVWSWGRDLYGGLGDDATLVDKPTPVAVSGECYISAPVIVPIELLSFIATAENNERVRCDWSTASEMNNHFFSLERSKDAFNFEEFIQKRSAAYAGYSNTILNYVDYDYDPYIGLSYYRLKQVDYNGQHKYSDIRSVYIGTTNIISIYPNPSFEGHIQYTIGSEEESNVKVELIDVLGRAVVRRQESFEKGITTKQISTANLGSGTYLIRITQGNEEKVQKQFLVK